MEVNDVNMNIREAKEALGALDRLVQWSKERGLPPAEWTAPLQDALSGKEFYNMGVKQFLFPIGVYDRHGILELANDKMLEGTGFTADDIKAGKADLYRVESLEFTQAVKLALKGETHAVNELQNPLEDISNFTFHEAPDYKSAILFPVFDEETLLRGAVVFLPFEYRPENETLFV